MSVISETEKAQWYVEPLFKLQTIRVLFHTKVKDFTGQNIVDLMKDSLRLKKGIEPRCWETFSKALHESNVPQQHIDNQARCKWMQKQNIDDDEVTESESDYRNLISF